MWGNSPWVRIPLPPRVIPLRDDNPTRRRSYVTWLIMAGAAAVFFLVQPSSEPDRTEFLYEQAAIPCEITSGAPLTFAEIEEDTCNDVPGPQFAPGKNVLASLVVAMFLHGSIAHLLGNLWVFWIFGNNIEDETGHLPFVVFYLAAGVVALFAYVLLHPDGTVPVVGASGAIAGIMGAYLILHPYARVTVIVLPFFFLPFRLPAAVFLGVWFVLQFLLAGGDENIAWEAHVGGFVFGVVVAAVLRATAVEHVAVR